MTRHSLAHTLWGGRARDAGGRHGVVTDDAPVAVHGVHARAAGLMARERMPAKPEIEFRLSARIALPSDFSAQQISLTVDEADVTKAAARRLTSDFPGMLGDGTTYPPGAPSSTAAASLFLESKGPFDSDTVTVAKF